MAPVLIQIRQLQTYNHRIMKNVVFPYKKHESATRVFVLYCYLALFSCFSLFALQEGEAEESKCGKRDYHQYVAESGLRQGSRA